MPEPTATEGRLPEAEVITRPKDLIDWKRFYGFILGEHSDRRDLRVRGAHVWGKLISTLAKHQLWQACGPLRALAACWMSFGLPRIWNAGHRASPS
jgi:hypothetical protein